MGTLGAMLVQRGVQVSGSDTMAYPPMSSWLESRGMVVQSGYEASHIPPQTDLVVVGNVARRDNTEAMAATERGLPCISLPEALRVFFLAGRRSLVVTGTHGKTTTSAMLAFLLHAAGKDPSLFVGGVTVDFDGSFRLGNGQDVVVEGDEYDSAYFDKVPKFWHYPAYAATINNVEFDHADIYPDLDAVKAVFQTFAEQVDPRGALWVNGDDAVAMAVSAETWADRKTFGLSPGLDLWADQIEAREDGLSVQLHAGKNRIGAGTVPVMGLHNVRNFLGAAGLALEAGVPLAESLRLIGGFRGVRRRQEIKGTVGGVVVIDDFAHHPTAVRETLSAIAGRYPGRRLLVAFEAKSNTSRRAVFQHDFPPAFVAASQVVVSRPWRKDDDLPSEQLLSIEQLVADIGAVGAGRPVALIPDVPEIAAHLVNLAAPGDVIVGLSGSAFGGLHELVLQGLRDRFGA